MTETYAEPSLIRRRHSSRDAAATLSAFHNNCAIREEKKRYEATNSEVESGRKKGEGKKEETRDESNEQSEQLRKDSP